MLLKAKYLLMGLLAGTLLLAGTSYSKSLTEKITARFANIKLIVNNNEIQTKAEPFIYNGNVYAPVATVANMLGVKQEWDNKTPAVRFTDPNVKITSADGTMFDQPLGNGLHFVQSKTTEFRSVLEDRLNGKTVPIPPPEELQGKSLGMIPITPAVSHLDFDTRNLSQYEFYVFNFVEGDQVFLQLLQYEKGKLTTLGAIKVAGQPNSSFGLYNDGRNSIYVQTYDKAGLSSSTEYTWNYENKRIEKVSELKVDR